jgi:hypothetical protein
MFNGKKVILTLDSFLQLDKKGRSVSVYETSTGGHNLTPEGGA